MKNLALNEIKRRWNSKEISLIELLELIDENGYESEDTTIVGENETHTLEYKDDCITLELVKKQPSKNKELIDETTRFKRGSFRAINQ